MEPRDENITGPANPEALRRGRWLRRRPKQKNSTHWDYTEHNICKNCGRKTTGKFCSHCGQRTDIVRLRFSSSIRSFFTTFFQVEKGLLGTVGMLFTRPGYLSRDYIDGKRTARTNPFTVLFIFATVYGLLYATKVMVTTGTPFTESWDDGLSSVFGDSLLGTIMQFIIRRFQNSVVLRSLAMLPVYTLSIKLLLRRANGGRYNYTELMFMGGYLAAQRMIIDIVALGVEWTTDWDTDKTVYCVYILLMAYTLRQFFALRWLKAIWKSVTVFLLSFFLLGVAIVILALIVFGIYYLITGETDLLFKGPGSGSAKPVLPENLRDAVLEEVYGDHFCDSITEDKLSDKAIRKLADSLSINLDSLMSLYPPDTLPDTLPGTGASDNLLDILPDRPR
ncbi:MAG: DUF3667 domain-containing protein [Rikenellaceae bacterium]|nr:DUF3667 domain-containing protein [Rikenellaceae bacterium]